jgi:hypothetical protein
MREGRAASALPWKRLFAELGVIIAGVLIALAVDSWWERRQERQRADEYLEQLLVDFQRTAGRLENTIVADTDWLQKSTSALARALDGPWPPADSLELPTGYNYFEPLTGTLAALIQSGDLRLVRSVSLRSELIAYSSVIQETKSVLRDTEAMIWNSTQRVLAGRTRHSQSAGRRAASGGRGWGQVNVAGALNDPDIISALQVQAMSSQIRVFNLERLKEPTSRIIDLIRAELR